MKFRKGAVCVFKAAGWDIFDGRTDLSAGELVRVCHPYGCPPPGTMGHYHVERVSDGKFAGLVCGASLTKVKKISKEGVVTI